MSFIHELGKKHLPRTISFMELWDRIGDSYLNKNNSNYGELRRSNMYVDLLGLYSGTDYITYLYSVDGYPRELENSFRTTLRNECRAGVRISFITHLEKDEIDWDSPQMKAKLHTWKILEENAEEVNAYNLHKTVETMDNQDWKKDSLTYLALATVRRKRKVFKLRSLMLISGVRGTNFNTTVDEVTKLCSLLKIKISRVIGDIPEYIKVFSPFSNLHDMRVLDRCGSVVLTDELLARFNTYSQGLIGRTGIIMGTDILSCFPCFKPVKITTESAENWLITAETGGGKSFLVKFIIVQLLADPKYRGTINDVEGFEYIPMGNYISQHSLVCVLNMAEGSGMYYDPVEITVTGDDMLDKDMYSLSSSFTLSLFKCLLGNTTDEDEWCDIVINDAVSLTYGKRGVDANDKNTWTRSKGLSLYDVYATLKSLKTNGDADRAISSMFSQSLYQERMGIGTKLSKNDVNRLVTNNKGYQLAIDMCIAKVSRYFEENGIKSHLFRNRIGIDQIRNAKLVICSFGMAGKSESSVDPIQMSLMQLYAANISHLRSIFSKNDGMFNFKLWEEFQRWGGFPDADKTINVALTGGRKLGDINIVLTNKVKDMLDNDKFGIFSNITSIAVGAIKDAKVREDLCKRLTIMHMLPELDKIAENNKDLSAYIDGDTIKRNPYSKAFLLGLDNTVYTIAKASIPAELASSDIFRTGINLKGDVE